MKHWSNNCFNLCISDIFGTSWNIILNEFTNENNNVNINGIHSMLDALAFRLYVFPPTAIKQIFRVKL